MSQSVSNFSGLVLKDDAFPLLTNTTMTQVGIEKNGNTISFDNLCFLPVVLASVGAPPDATTLAIDHRIVLEDTTDTQTTVDLRNDSFIMNDTINNNYYSFNSTTLQVDNATNPSYIRMSANEGLVIQNDTRSGAPTNTNTFTHTDITIDNTLGGGPKNTITAGDLSISDNTNTLTSLMTADNFTLTNNSGIVPATNTLSSSNMIIRDDNYGYTNTLTNNSSLLNDDNAGNPIQLECVTDHTQDPDPFIRFQNSTGQNNYLKFGGIYADGHFTFNLDNNERFFKQNNPMSMTQYTLANGDYIEQYMPLVFSENPSGGLKLRPYTEYLDDNGNSGWSCIISNFDGGDLQVDTNGLGWFSHSNGNNANPVIVKKWATCRLTLVYSSASSVYLWALSQF